MCWAWAVCEAEHMACAGHEHVACVGHEHVACVGHEHVACVERGMCWAWYVWGKRSWYVPHRRMIWCPVVTTWGRIIKTLVKLQCSAPCISSYNMKATMCQQCCKSGSYKINKFIFGKLYVLLRRAHCSQHMATYNMGQPIRERVKNDSKSLFVIFHSYKKTQQWHM